MGVNHELGQLEESPGDTAPLDAEGFTLLVREHQAGLRAFLRALGVEADWVDDLAQEVFLIAYRKQAQFENGKEFGRWLRGIARRVVANERRKEARHSRLLDAAMPDLMAAAQVRVEDLLENGPDPIILALNECVRVLPERGRTLLFRRYEKGDTAPALALVFNLSPDAVRQMLVRLRASVKRCVEAKLAETDQ
jgi:RNA polymerase sigma-70 factor, ECF subfamily